jgi:hypothetical protein
MVGGRDPRGRQLRNRGGMIRILMLALALLAGTGITAEGQNGGRQGDRDPDPVPFLIGLREELRLSDAQVEHLRQIESDAARLNRPLVSRMGELRTQIRALGPRDKLEPEQLTQFDAHVAEARQAMEQIQANNWAAMRRVGDVLTERQKEHVAKILRELGEGTRERSGDISRPSGTGS